MRGFTRCSTYRYMIPVLLLSPYIITMVRTRLPIPGFQPKTADVTPSTPPPTTEETLSRAISDVTILLHFLPSFPSLSISSAAQSLPSKSLVRLLVLSYIPYLILTHTLHVRVIIGIIGTVYLTWRAPWIHTIRHLVSQNGWVRYLARRAYAFATSTTPTSSLSISSLSLSLSGISSSSTLSNKSKAPLEDIPEVPKPSTFQFRLTVHENQRWWMGLDWTAALLPQERASWSSSPPGLHPLPPPISVTLPAPKTVWLPVPGKGRVSVLNYAISSVVLDQELIHF